MSEENDLIGMTADIVSAFVSHNTVRPAELAELLQAVYGSLQALGIPKPAEEPAAELKPAVPVKKSITDDYIISLEDGRKFKSMKRYLSGLGMTPDDYRAKWGLPGNYPMVAPGYAAKRSQLAKAAGLGARRQPEAAPAASDDAWEAAAPNRTNSAAEIAPAERRGRPKKAA